jgi:hypothetical protein
VRTYHLADPYLHGDPPGDLKPLQQALKTAKLYRGAIDDVFGPATGDSCKRAWYRLGAPLKSCTPHGDQGLLNLLRGTTKIPPLWIARRHARGFGITKAQKQRDDLVVLMRWCMQNESAIHYRQSRPMENMRRPVTLPWWSDCSEYVGRLFSIVGVDCYGNGYQGIGNTDTLLNHGTVIPLVQAKPGDVVVWPPWSPSHHTAFIFETTNPRDPWLSSHGREAGPNRIQLSAETEAQNRPYVIKRYIND